MDIKQKHVEITLGKDDRLSVIVHVDDGGDFLSPVNVEIVGGAERDGYKAFMSVEDLGQPHGDAPEYFITNRGLIKSPML